MEFDLADGLMGALADGLGELADESLGLVEDVLGVDGAVLDRRVDDEWMINLLGLFVPLSTPIVLGLMGNDSLSLEKVIISLLLIIAIIIQVILTKITHINYSAITYKRDTHTYTHSYY